MIRFDVVGHPAPQGSKVRLPNGAMIEGSSTGMRARHRDWRSAVAEAARTHAPPEPLDGPLTLHVTFRFPMPASRPKYLRHRGEIPKRSAPDLDKLIRALGDALQAGGLISDDARLTEIRARKLEVVSWTGAVVTIGEVES